MERIEIFTMCCLCIKDTVKHTRQVTCIFAADETASRLIKLSLSGKVTSRLSLDDR